MLDTDAFKVRSVRFDDCPTESYEHIIDNLIKGYDVKGYIEEPSNYCSHDLDKVSFKPVEELCAIKRAPCVLLNECLDKMVILRVIMAEKIDGAWYKYFSYRPPEQRFTGEDESEFALYVYTNSRKLTKDICLIHNILYNALIELQRYESVNVFLQTMEVLEAEIQDAENLSNDFSNNIVHLTRISRELRDSYRKGPVIYSRKLDDIYRIEQAYENMILYSDLKLKYTNKWENDRYYLNNFRNTGREQTLKSCIQEYTQKIMSENRIHNEISTYINQTIDDNTNKIDIWMENYDKELETLEGKIFEVKVDREKWETDFTSLKREYETRSEEIKRWLNLQEDIRKEAELAIKLNAAAIRIQAWWRGVMVRRHLGPYKQRKKGKGKNGKRKGAKKQRK